MDKQIYYLMHVHKCGGTSLFHAIENMLGNQNVFWIDGRKWKEEEIRFQHLEEKSKANHKAVIGHMLYGYHKHFDYPYKYITILREPLERMVSFYNYVFREEILDYHKLLIEKKPGFVDLVTSGIVPEMDNGITRFISGVNWNEVPYGEVNEDVFNLAIENIKNDFVFIGTLDRFNQSLLVIRNEFGCSSYPIYVSSNETKKKTKVIGAPPILKSLRDRELKQIQHYIKWDEKLYKFAYKRYANKYDNLKSIQLKNFEKINTLYHWWYKNVKQNRYVKAAFSRIS